MNKEDAIKYLQQLYPNGGHCWLDEQRIEAIGMAVKALQEEPLGEDLGKVGSLKSLEYYPEKKTTNKTGKGVFDANMPRRKAYLRGFKDGAHAHKELIANKPVSEELEEAANAYISNEANYSHSRTDTFKAGAEWGKNQAMAEIQAQSMALAHGCPKEPVSIWHDAKEPPEMYRKYLARYSNGRINGSWERHDDGFIPWKDVIKDHNITHWCYVEDLLKL